MTQVVLLTGGNLGAVARTLEKARRQLIRRVGPERMHSTVQSSAPWGFEAPDPFLNQVLVLETDLCAEEVLDAAQQIEQELGRQREPGGANGKRTYHSRPIDIDILFYGRQIIHTPRLSIPHPLIAQREFVLSPLAEVLPDWLHPETGQPMSELLQNIQHL